MLLTAIFIAAVILVWAAYTAVSRTARQNTAAHNVDSEPPVALDDVPPPYTQHPDGDNIQLIPPRSAEYGDRAVLLARLRRTNGADPHLEDRRPSRIARDTNQQRATAPPAPPPRFLSTSTQKLFKIVVDESSPRRGNKIKALLQKGGKVKGLLRTKNASSGSSIES